MTRRLMQALLDLVQPFETWVVLPVLVLAALALTVILRAPQFVRLLETWRGLGGDPSAPGEVTSGAALALSAASTAAGAIVGTATAISLGGAGAVAWLWLFGILVAPLRYGETLLARSSAPGKAGGQHFTGSLAARLAGDSSRTVAQLGVAVGLVVPVAAFAVVGGVHGAALADASNALLPGSGLYLGAIAAAAGLAFWLVPAARKALGWIGLAAFVALFVALVLPIAHDAGRAFRMFPRALDDAFHGSGPAGAFTGAIVGEVARAAIRHGLIALSSTVGADGGIHAAARAPSARAQAAIASFSTLVHVVVVTFVGMAIMGSGAFSRRTDGERRLSEVVWVDAAYETASQRLETERRWTGYLRIVDGVISGDPRPIGIERSMATEVRFEELDGSPSDFALRVADGRITSLLRLDADGALAEQPDDEADRVRIVGNMLPRGGALLMAAAIRGGGDFAARLLLAALVLLSALAAAGWGVAARAALARDLGEGPARAGLGIAAAGLVLGASGIAPFLPDLAALVGGLAAVLGALGILSKLRELDRIVTPPKAAVAGTAPAKAAPAKGAAKKKR